MDVRVFVDPSADRKTVHALLVLSAASQGSIERPPSNLALVVDRSSSMRGPRFAYALAACRDVVAALGERDRLSIIAFDAAAHTVFGPARLDDEAKGLALAAIDDLETGVGTNLGAAMRKASDALRSGFVRGAVSRMILLTDGHASIGVTDSTRLAELAAEEAAHGLSVTAMGLGEGFDDALLTEIARNGRGGFAYLASPADIPAAFGAELAGVFSLAATRVEVKLLPDEEVDSLDVLHRLPTRAIEGGLVIEVGDIAVGSPRLILLRLNRSQSASKGRVATITVTAKDMAGCALDPHLLQIALPTLPITADQRVVGLERARIAVAATTDIAWARRAAGDNARIIAGVHAVERDLRAMQAAGALGDDDLAPLLEDLAAAIAAVEASGDEREKIRRRLRERSMITMIGQSTIRKLPVADD